MNQIPKIEDPGSFLLMTAVIFVIVVVRYFIAAGIFHLVFYRGDHGKWHSRKVNHRDYKKGQFQKEMQWSLVSSLIFAVAGSLTVWLWQEGRTQIYEHLGWFDIIYVPLSLVVAMFLHETYYYWVHKAMHHPKVFKHVHKVHHESLISSPWTAFSFHPLEALLEAIILPLIVLLIPMHPVTILIHLVVMTLSSVINHLDIEIYPKNFENHWLGKWIIGATHHSLHHKDFKTNYGLYFTFWDKWMATENIHFNEIFRKKTQ